MRINEFRAWVESDRVMNYKVMVGNTYENDENYTSSIIWNGHDCVHLDSGSGIHVMQYTGLRDKNGVKIYEGDIVKFGGNKYAITFTEGGFGVERIYQTGEKTIKVHEPLWNLIIDGCEVIGNIYENNDLLEE